MVQRSLVPSPDRQSAHAERRPLAARSPLSVMDEQASPASAAMFRLQRTVGNQAVSHLVSHIQRCAGGCGPMQDRQPIVAQSADIEEVPIDDDAQVQALHDASLQRDDDIPPPPPAFPNVFSWRLAQPIVDAVNEAWGVTCADGLERAFIVMWHEQNKRIWPGEVVTGSHTRVNVNMPGDRPPVYPIGHVHTHPKPTRGFTRTPGPSGIDLNDAATNHLPHAVEDFTDKSFNCRVAGSFFFGPNVRP